MARRPIQGSIHSAGNDSSQPGTGDDLRAVMQHWPTGVAVLAVRQGDSVQSITINSFISVSLTPPIILVSIAQTAAIRPPLEEAGRFTLSILGTDQSKVASMVADRMPMLARLFEPAPHAAVQEAIASMVCTITEQHEGGDHILYLAAVESAQLGRDASPLMYFGGSYQ